MLQCSKGSLEAPTEGKAKTKQINANKKHGFRRAFVFLCMLFLHYILLHLYTLNFNQICIAGLAACVAARNNNFVALTK